MTTVAVIEGEASAARRVRPLLRRRGLLAFAAAPGAIVVVLAVVGPWIAPHALGETVGLPFAKPANGTPLGTDHLGRDVLSQLLRGGRRIIVLPVIATLVTAVAGGFVGIIAGYARGRADAVVSRVVDVMIAVPSVLVLLVLVNGWGSSGLVLVFVVLLTSGPYAVRFARATTQQIASAGFVEQAAAVGERPLGIVVRELLPNVAGPLAAQAALRLIGAIFLVGSASFLGFGPERPATDWAAMITDNLAGSGLNAWAVIAPAIAIVALTTSVLVVADIAARRWAR